MKTLFKLVLLGVAATFNLLAPSVAQAQVKEQRNPGHAFQRMSRYNTYEECRKHNFKLHGDSNRAYNWCSRQGYTQ
jgi:hypothetical protein